MPDPVGITNVEGLAFKYVPEPVFAVGVIVCVGMLIGLRPRPRGSAMG
jgi:hypothetical protein